jgi:hypothetical protein
MAHVDGLDDSAGYGVQDQSVTGRGVVGSSNTWQGVYGHSVANAGVVGEADKFHAIYGVSQGLNNAALFGVDDGNGYGIIISTTRDR